MDIHIKKSHEGLLTEKAHAAGFSDPLGFAHHVLAHKDKQDGATIKQAQFAVNASHWAHRPMHPEHVKGYADHGAQHQGGSEYGDFMSDVGHAVKAHRLRRGHHS